MDITPFDFEGKPIRAITDADGNPWFVAKDVCDILGYENSRDAIQKHCKQPELLKSSDSRLLDIPARGLTIINEPDLYRLMMRSNLPEAERFEQKVVGEILPAIRKHGGYLTPAAIEKALLNPDFIIGLATNLKAEQAKVAALAAENKRLEPKAAAHDALMLSDTALPIGSVAKALHKDFGIGRNRLFALLRDRGVLMANNEPKQVYMDRGYFRVIERRFEVNGEMRVGTQTLVYQKGVSFIHRLLREDQAMTAMMVQPATSHAAQAN